MSAPKKIQLSYTKALVDKLTDFPKNHVIPCSVLVNDTTLGGLFIIATTKDLKTFKVKVNSPISFPIKFRMLNIGHKTFLIEVCLLYKEQPEKFIRLHLNPYDPVVVQFLTICLEQKAISFHFHNADTKSLASAITTLNGEEIDWLERNLSLVTKLSPNPLGFNEIRTIVESTIKPTDKLFKCYAESSPDFFVREGSVLARFK